MFHQVVTNSFLVPAVLSLTKYIFANTEIDLPLSAGNTVVLTIVDWFSDGALHTFAQTSCCLGIARLLIMHVFVIYGNPYHLQLCSTIHISNLDGMLQYSGSLCLSVFLVQSSIKQPNPAP